MGNRFREKVVEEGLESEEQRQESIASETEASTAADTALFANDEVERDDMPRESKGRGGRAARGVAKVLGGDILADKMVLRQIPLLLLCLFFLLLLVANRYRVESLSREKIATMERINDLREHRIQMQKQYQESVKISHIADDLSETGVGITSGPPYEIEK